MQAFWTAVAQAGWWFDPQLLQPAIFTPNASISVCVCVCVRQKKLRCLKKKCLCQYV